MSTGIRDDVALSLAARRWLLGGMAARKVRWHDRRNAYGPHSSHEAPSTLNVPPWCLERAPHRRHGIASGGKWKPHEARRMALSVCNLPAQDPMYVCVCVWAGVLPVAFRGRLPAPSSLGTLLSFAKPTSTTEGPSSERAPEFECLRGINTLGCCTP